MKKTTETTTSTRSAQLRIRVLLGADEFEGITEYQIQEDAGYQNQPIPEDLKQALDAVMASETMKKIDEEHLYVVSATVSWTSIDGKLSDVTGDATHNLDESEMVPNAVRLFSAAVARRCDEVHESNEPTPTVVASLMADIFVLAAKHFAPIGRYSNEEIAAIG